MWRGEDRGLNAAHDMWFDLRRERMEMNDEPEPEPIRRGDDGMHLDHGLAIHLQSVPAADEAFLAKGEAMVDQALRELDELAKAPMMEEEYDGPILFSAEASAQLLASTVATEATGVPAPLAEGGRMMDLEPAWQKRLNKGVMPPFIDLIDDPTLPKAFGSFQMDAQGVKHLLDQRDLAGELGG